MHHYKQYLSNPWKLIRVLGGTGRLNWIPDKVFLKLMFRAEFGKKLNLNDPKTYNEKVQWLKLYDRNPIYTDLVDKIKVREYVKNKIGEKYLIPILGVWDDPDEIDFGKLPEQFVLKCNHDSGTVIICKGKSQLNIQDTIKYLRKQLNRNFYWGGREWPYKNVKPKILCEKYMDNKDKKGLTDYKIYCFGGEPKMMMIATDRFTDKQTHFDYFDQDFNWLDFEWGNPHSDIPPSIPDKYDDMMRIAGILSKGIPHVRVDLYEIDGEIYFGEMTFFDGSGFQEISPISWDNTLGSWIDLPQKEK